MSESINVVDLATADAARASRKGPTIRRRGGAELLLEHAAPSYERLPMLDVVCDRFVRVLMTTLRGVLNDNVVVAASSVTSDRFADRFEVLPDNGMYAVFKAEEWENYGLLVFDAPLICMVIDSLLGGGGLRKQASRVERRHTMIDRALIEPLVHSVLADLGQAFGPLCAVTFRFERLELSDRFVHIARATDGVVGASFTAQVGESRGTMTLILPHATLEPVRDVLLQQFMGEKFGHDATWEHHLSREIWTTNLEMEVVIEDDGLTLGDILPLRPGDQLVLRQGGASSARLRCGDRTLYQGRLGQLRGRLAFKVEKRADEERPPFDLEGDLLPTEQDHG
ncbi:FliM/FliN family flagellar motor switch protein [Acidomonas methanolica]|uniref:FliM/FliN family flagellar motor switch protein n=1 Tax=Acidomonas methanolica TaxID=437 RepID=UPI002119DD41|nr:FliM/FliN family flagellar motor switch protein [Acidomonas methanolica]MCQ9155469.1 FliM/FliN family flagellar motor switch protein [Acidomonas methanolica]